MDIRPAFAERNLPVAISTDENFLPYAKVLIVSIVACTKSANLDVLVLHSGISEKGQGELLASFDLGPRLSIRFIDVRDSIRGTKLENYGCGDARPLYPISTCLRLLLPCLLPAYDKVIYLDVDAIVCSDLSELYNEDLGDCLFGAVRDMFPIAINKEYFQWAKSHGLTEFDDHVNAGILLMNLDGIRKADIFDALIERVMDAAGWYLDQDAINIVCKGRIRHLDSRWNYQVGGYCVQKQMLLAPLGPLVCHYTVDAKPWLQPQHLFAHLWWRHAGRDGAALWRRAYGNPEPTRIGDGVCASVVLALNDSEDYLHETLYSLEAQTLENAEFICIANGMNAATRCICETFAERDSRFRIVDLPGQSVSAAMNAGIDMAKGRWLFFAEADDLCRPEMLADMCAAGDKEGSDAISAAMYALDLRMTSLVRAAEPPRTRFGCEGIEPWGRAFGRKLVAEGGIRFRGEVDDGVIRFSVEALSKASNPCFLGKAYYSRRKDAYFGRLGRAPCEAECIAAAYAEAKKLVDGADMWTKYDFFKAAVTHCIRSVLDLKTHEDRERAVSYLRTTGFPALHFRGFYDSNIYQEDFGEALMLVEKGASAEDVLVALLYADERVKLKKVTALAEAQARLRARLRPTGKNARQVGGRVAERQKLEVEALRNSEAYRVGMFVTWPARKMWGGIKCLRENGVKYTLKHAIGKVLRKCGQKATW